MPSPVIATTWPLAFSASTMARFCSGVTRPNTEWVDITARSASGSWGSREASTPSPSTCIPTSRATAATVRGWSPEMTFSPTFWPWKYSRVCRASERTFSLKVSSATG